MARTPLLTWATDRYHWIARVVLSVVVVVELLGGLKLLPLRAEFTWKGLLLQSVAALVGFEVLSWLVRRYQLSYVVGVPALAFALLITFDAVGDIGHLYGAFTWYDQVAHTFGGFVAGLAATSTLAAVHSKLRGPERLVHLELFFSGVAFAAMLATLYEITEYTEDLLTGSHRLGDGFDTANDLVLGMAGGLVAAALVVWLPKLRFTR